MSLLSLYKNHKEMFRFHPTNVNLFQVPLISVEGMNHKLSSPTDIQEQYIPWASMNHHDFLELISPCKHLLMNKFHRNAWTNLEVVESAGSHLVSLQFYVVRSHFVWQVSQNNNKRLTIPTCPVTAQTSWLSSPEKLYLRELSFSNICSI